MLTTRIMLYYDDTALWMCEYYYYRRDITEKRKEKKKPHPCTFRISPGSPDPFDLGTGRLVP